MKTTSTLYHFVAWLCLVACMATFTSCEDDKDVAVTSVTLNSDPANALRYPVDLTFADECEASIVYWPVDNPSNRRATAVHRSVGKKARVIINFVKATTDYKFAVCTNGKLQPGEYTFKTSTLPGGVPVYNVAVDNGGAPTEGYILQWQASKPGYLTFCDMDGNVVWYERFTQAVRQAHYDPEQGRVAVMTGFRDGQNSAHFQRLCDSIFTLDLEGNYDVKIRPDMDNVPYPHHDIRFLPDGNLIFVCNYIKNYDLTQFGLGEDVPVWGDGFAVMTPEGSVLRRWDNFEECTPYNSNNRITEKGATYDFLHANSVNWDSNGDYYMTFNRLNQLWKIDGKTGKVLYRVGVNGNVALDQEYYANGIHAAVPLSPNRVLVYDNGSDRGYSRALIYDVNPTAMTATVSLNVAIPTEYSSTDRSNVQLICNDKILMFGNTVGRTAVFTDLNGKILKVISRNGISYRTYYYPEI